MGLFICIALAQLSSGEIRVSTCSATPTRASAIFFIASLFLGVIDLSAQTPPAAPSSSPATQRSRG